MEIRKLDLNSDDLRTVSEMILDAYEESGQTIPYEGNSIQIVEGLVETGNNFIGHENIYICCTDNSLAGLIIGYSGKPYSKVKTFVDLLIKFNLNKLLSYLLVGSQLLDTIYTPKLKEDDYYISVIVVDKKYRNQGIGSLMLNQASHIAREKGCSRIVLEVGQQNLAAQSLYKKYGFHEISNDKSEQINNEYSSMEYILN